MADNWWTAERLAKARELWDEGLSSALVGARLGTTKNAVLGMVHRRKWPPRPSPIKTATRAPNAAPRAPRPAPIGAGSTPPPLVAVPATPRPPVPAKRAPKPYQRIGECVWIISDRRPPVFCCVPTRPNSPYCPKHHARAYITRPELRAEMFDEAAD